jgi:hypothetical protein
MSSALSARMARGMAPGASASRTAHGSGELCMSFNLTHGGGTYAHPDISDFEGPGSYVRCVSASQGDLDNDCHLDVLGAKLSRGTRTVVGLETSLGHCLMKWYLEL